MLRVLLNGFSQGEIVLAKLKVLVISEALFDVEGQR